MDNNTVTKRTKDLNFGSIIKLLFIIALVCTAFSCISYLFRYYASEKINGKWIYELIFFPLFPDLILMLLALAPFVLFALYVFKFHNDLKATVLVPIIFGLFPLKILFDFLFGSGRFVIGLIWLIWLIIALIIASCILAIISALKGFNNKLFIIIFLSICLLYEALSLIGFFSNIEYYIENSTYLYLFTSPLGIIGESLLYVAVLLFCLKNKIPSIILLSPKKEKSSEKNSNPEQALRLLKDKLDLGMITEEEYQAQRAEIIDKL